MNELLRHQSIEMMFVRDLRGYERNARLHSDANVNTIANAIQEFGWTQPIIIDRSDMIVAGHGRFAAAKLLGMDTVPCIRVSDLSPEKVRALVLSDNRVGDDSVWDDRLLAEELKAIQQYIDDGDLDMDFASIGFTDAEVADLMPLLDDAAPAEPARDITVEDEPAVARPGETWQLGTHRFTVGGSAAARDADLVIRAWERETKEEAKLSPGGETFKSRAAALGIEFVRPSVKSQKARTKGD